MKIEIKKKLLYFEFCLKYKKYIKMIKSSDIIEIDVI